MGKEDFFNLRMSGGKFQGANCADFSRSSTFYTFEGPTNGCWYEVSILNTNKYKYLRYIGPPSSYCNINEMEFFDENGTKLQGRIIGTEGVDWAPKENVFDGNILTGFNSVSPDGNWVGIRLSAPHRITKIRFIGRNDGNGIEVGDEYELVYWDEGWKVFGTRIATENQVAFDRVPLGGLYLLHDKTEGSEERIFTYEKSEQIWW